MSSLSVSPEPMTALRGEIFLFDGNGVFMPPIPERVFLGEFPKQVRGACNRGFVPRAESLLFDDKHLDCPAYVVAPNKEQGWPSHLTFPFLFFLLFVFGRRCSVSDMPDNMVEGTGQMVGRSGLVEQGRFFPSIRRSLNISDQRSCAVYQLDNRVMRLFNAAPSIIDVLHSS